MASTFRLRQGSPEDFFTVIALIEEAAEWLRGKGTGQWQAPWPNPRERDARVLGRLERGETWLLWDGPVPAGTITARLEPNKDLWPRDRWPDPAVYLHQLVVRRAHAGRRLGERLFDWAGWQARLEHQVDRIRIDVWTDNFALHEYYEERGFAKVGECELPHYPSGMLFEKKIPEAEAVPSWPFTAEPADRGPLRGAVPGKRHRKRGPYGVSHRISRLPHRDGGR